MVDDIDDESPISKQILNFMFETKEIKYSLGIWITLQLIMLVLLIYITIKI